MDEHPKPRLRKADRSRKLLATTLDELVSHDHPVRAIWDYVNLLDLEPLEKCIRAVEGVPGRNATDPRVLLALWIWATSDGIGSARAIERLCRECNPYQWLAGGVSLNYHLLSSFRSNHEAVFDKFLRDHVSALLHQGLIELACVAQDGMRTRASAGAGSFRRGPTIEECQELVRQQLEELKRQEDEPLDAVSRRQKAAQERHAQQRRERLAEARQVAEQLQAKKDERLRRHPNEAKGRSAEEKSARASTTDPESRRMKMPDGGTRPAYNVQAATTTDTGIIVGVSVSNQGSDGGLMGPMVDQIEASYDRKLSQYLVDGGFSSKEDVELAHEREIEVYSPLRNEKKDLSLGKDPYIPKPSDGEGVAAWRVRMGTAEAKELYKKRASTAEWVNAGMRNRGLYGVMVRGLSKVSAVVLLHALVHNVLQTIRLCVAKKPEWKWIEILRAGLKQVRAKRTMSLVSG
jgi:transposase